MEENEDERLGRTAKVLQVSFRGRISNALLERMEIFR
jgi:hypothetical protein